MSGIIQRIQRDFLSAKCDTNTAKLVCDCVLCASLKYYREHKIAHYTDKGKYFPVKNFQCISYSVLYKMLRDYRDSPAKGTREKEEQKTQAKKCFLFSKNDSHQKHRNQYLYAKAVKRNKNWQTAEDTVYASQQRSCNNSPASQCKRGQSCGYVECQCVRQTVE